MSNRDTIFEVEFTNGERGKHIAVGDWTIREMLAEIEHLANLKVGMLLSITMEKSDLNN